MISTHILDTSLGQPAANVEVSLWQKNKSGEFIMLNQGLTNSDGRFVFNSPFEKGIYQIIFGIKNYYQSKNIPFFFLDNSVIFQIDQTERKYHVPLLLNPYGYSTYRGS
jgi:5-hydroxyisourate hydrolase